MVLQSAGRPLGPLKSLLRQHRHARQLVARTMATETNNTPAPPADAAPGAPIPPAAKAPVGPAPPTKFRKPACPGGPCVRRPALTRVCANQT